MSRSNTTADELCLILSLTYRLAVVWLKPDIPVHVQYYTQCKACRQYIPAATYSALNMLTVHNVSINVLGMNVVLINITYCKRICSGSHGDSIHCHNIVTPTRCLLPL